MTHTTSTATNYTTIKSFSDVRNAVEKHNGLHAVLPSKNRVQLTCEINDWARHHDWIVLYRRTASGAWTVTVSVNA